MQKFALSYKVVAAEDNAETNDNFKEIANRSIKSVNIIVCLKFYRVNFI